MAKGNIVKPPVNDGIRVEIVVIDDDEVNPIFPVDDHNVGHEFISNPVDDSPPTFDKDVQPVPVVDLPVKGQTVETNFPTSYQAEGMIPPMFITCLLDNIRSMEGRVVEMSAHQDIVEAENLKLKEQLDADTKSLLCVKNHKNRLIQRVLKLQNENDKNEEKVRELNAQITLMQFKGPSHNSAKGVNIQVFSAHVNL